MYRRIFFPDTITHSTPELFGLDYETVYFRSEDGQRLIGWFIPALNVDSPKEAKGTVIHMHSNSANMTSHWQFAGWLPNYGYNVFAFDYRGFGKSYGEAEPKGILEDSVAALSYIRSRTDIDTSKLFIFGQSLGAGVGIASAAISPEGIRAVAVESAFYSYSLLVDDRRPGDGFAYEKDDLYSAAPYVGKLSPIPLLLIHGDNDGTTSHEHSERLYAEANEPKTLVIIPYGRHMAAMTERFGVHFQDMIMEFFQASLAK